MSVLLFTVGAEAANETAAKGRQDYERSRTEKILIVLLLLQLS